MVEDSGSLDVDERTARWSCPSQSGGRDKDFYHPDERESEIRSRKDRVRLPIYPLGP